MTPLGIFGLTGAIIIAISWLPQTYEIIKHKKNKLNTKFNLLIFIGSLILTIYASMINDIPFLFLNLIATVSSGIGLYYKFREYT